MKVFQWIDPGDERFAHASRRGTWTPATGLCPGCTASSQERIRPLVLEWEPGSDLVGDFTWPSLGADVAITQRVLKTLKDRFRGFEPGPVEMLQDPKLKQPEWRSGRSEPRVWLPYEEPPLYDLCVTSWVHIDFERSSAWLVKRCDTCGRETHAVDGVERWEATWEKEVRKLIKTHFTRGSGLGLYVRSAELNGADIFRIYEFPGAIFCTAEVKQRIEVEGFTNVAFLEMGETFE